MSAFKAGCFRARSDLGEVAGRGSDPGQADPGALAEPETDPAHGDDPVAAAELVAQAADVGVDRTPGPGVTPDLGHDPLARDDGVGEGGEQAEQIEFFAGDLDP